MGNSTARTDLALFFSFPISLLYCLVLARYVCSSCSSGILSIFVGQRRVIGREDGSRRPSVDGLACREGAGRYAVDTSSIGPLLRRGFAVPIALDMQLSLRHAVLFHDVGSFNVHVAPSLEENRPDEGQS